MRFDQVSRRGVFVVAEVILVFPHHQFTTGIAQNFFGDFEPCRTGKANFALVAIGRVSAEVVEFFRGVGEKPFLGLVVEIFRLAR